MSRAALFRFQFADLPALQNEVTQNLSKGRAFLRGASGALVRERCALYLVHPESQKAVTLPAEAVFIQNEGAFSGIGFELLNWDEGRAALLQLFVESGIGETVPSDSESPLALEPVLPANLGDGDPESLEEDTFDPRSPRVQNIYDRVRRMSAREQQQLARTGNLTERTALERCFAGAVWEGLLQNSQISGAEVARIAKKGTLPKPLLSQILASGTWLAIPEVQRALLGNPRVAGAELVRVLRAMPRQALQTLQHQTAYRSVVRAEAKKLLAP